MINFRGAKRIPAMNHKHFFADAGKQQCVRSGRIAAAHDGNRFSLVEHPVAGCTVIYAPPNQFFFSGQSEFPGICSG